MGRDPFYRHEPNDLSSITDGEKYINNLIPSMMNNTEYTR